MRTLQLGVAALPLLMSKALLLPFSRAVIFQPSNLGNIMPDLATLNSTMGHPNILWSLGLGYNPDIQDAASVSTSLDESSEDEDEVDESTQFIPITEMTEALGVALRLSEASMEDIKAEGWNLVFSSPLISLLKRRVKKAGRNPGPVEYLMLGRVTDVSPRTFLHAQINRQSRARWDRTMNTMEVPGDPLAEADGLVKGSKRSQDTLYYRTKWPWPLKDRDYTLVLHNLSTMNSKAL